MFWVFLDVDSFRRAHCSRFFVGRRSRAPPSSVMSALAALLEGFRHVQITRYTHSTSVPRFPLVHATNIYASLPLVAATTIILYDHCACSSSPHYRVRARLTSIAPSPHFRRRSGTRLGNANSSVGRTCHLPKIWSSHASYRKRGGPQGKSCSLW